MIIVPFCAHDGQFVLTSIQSCSGSNGTNKLSIWSCHLRHSLPAVSLLPINYSSNSLSMSKVPLAPSSQPGYRSGSAIAANFTISRYHQIELEVW